MAGKLHWSDLAPSRGAREVLWGAVMLLTAAFGVQALPANRTALLLSQRINQEGPFLGLVVAEHFEMTAIRQQGLFTPHQYIPWLDLAGRRFHIGHIEGHKVILVRSAAAMLNAGITTQQLLDFFDVTGVLHYGIAGSANDSLNIGDISIPKYWAHTGLWNWQKYSHGSNNFLSSGPKGDYTTDIGHLHFGDYDSPKGNGNNLLSDVWIQPEEVFAVTGTPEAQKHAFWIKVNKRFYRVAKQLEGMDLKSCFNATTCLNMKPKVVVGLRGASANVFVDNAAYREFLFKTLNVSSLDMESASVALVCFSNNIPFVVIRSISDLAGSSEGINEASAFKSLASLNAVKVLRQFLKTLQETTEVSSSWASHTV